LLQGELTGLCLRCGLACEGLMRIALWLRGNERPAVSPCCSGFGYSVGCSHSGGTRGLIHLTGPPDESVEHQPTDPQAPAPHIRLIPPAPPDMGARRRDTTVGCRSPGARCFACVGSTKTNVRRFPGFEKDLLVCSPEAHDKPSKCGSSASQRIGASWKAFQNQARSGSSFLQAYDRFGRQKLGAPSISCCRSSVAAQSALRSWSVLRKLTTTPQALT
jgi:hypothetical protein